MHIQKVSYRLLTEEDWLLSYQNRTNRPTCQKTGGLSPCWIAIQNRFNKSIASRIRKVLPKIINNDQTGFLNGRFIGENIRLIDSTSSNQRLWECVRRHFNFYTDTLNDFPSWLSTSKNQPFFINNRGFTERYFSDKVHAILIEEVHYKLCCATAPVSVDSQVL